VLAPSYSLATFAGMLIEVVFLIGGLLALFPAAILAAKACEEKA
jgi:hypothetical protein